MTDLITIGIPVYERKEYFEEALTSALDQTVKCPIIVVDNASSHTHFQDMVASKAAGASAPLSYVRNETNIGLLGNWNRCAELAQTPFVVVLSDDDTLDSHYVEEFLAALREHPDLDFYYTALERFGPAFHYHAPQAIRFGLFDGIEAVRDAALHGLCWPTNSTAYRTDFLRANPWRNPSPKRHSNADWLLAYTFAAGRSCYGNPKPLYKLRSHSHNAGGVSVAYTVLSRSEVYYRIGLQLRGRRDRQAAQAAFAQSALEVVNTFIQAPEVFQKVVHASLEDADEFILFIERTWAPQSPAIACMMHWENPAARRLLWVCARIFRFLSRVWPSPFRRFALGRFKPETARQ